VKEKNMNLPALLAQIPAAVAQSEAPPQSVLSMILNSGPVVKFTLLVLIVFSVASWAIIFFKYGQLKRAKRTSNGFLQSYDHSYSIEELLTKPAPQDGNPLYSIFSAGISDILRFKQVRAKDPNAKVPLNLEHIHKNIRRSQNNETHKLEQLTSFLATTASAAPFIGLFGTVWGILTAFFTIGQQKTTSLAVVGPYIAEALVATAVGLAAAIPAVIAYNYFITRIRDLDKELGDFSSDLETRIEKEYF
jgi:biopolymer transport protein TolQ